MCPARTMTNGCATVAMSAAATTRRSRTSTQVRCTGSGLSGIITSEPGGGLEATPLVIDGIMYAVGNWGRVYSLDAATGAERWRYDPEVDGQWGRYACCDVVNRGLAVAEHTVYVGALDGYLHALDSDSGKRRWKVDTLIGRD